MVKVEVIYIPQGRSAIHHQLPVVPGSTVAKVIAQTGIEQSHPEVLDLAVGIFSQLIPRDTIVRSGDRIEIYRDLLIDPKEKRRRRAGK